MDKLEKVNRQGLNPVASVLKYAKTKPAFNAVRVKGRVFRLTTLHANPLGPRVLDSNKRGFTNAKANTVAHAPSLYYWYFYRCGISFLECKQLLEHRRLKANDVLLQKESDLEAQLDWEELRSMNIQVQNDHGEWVPALQRARHRWYSLHVLDRQQSQLPDEAEPRSFVHQYQPFLKENKISSESQKEHAAASATQGPRLSAPTSSSLNVIRPCGMISHKVSGLSLVTNDVSTLRHWNNEALGNNGLYDVRFPMGTPDEVFHGALKDAQKHLREIASRAERFDNPDLHVAKQPYTASLQELPDALRGKKDVASLLHQLEVARQRKVPKVLNNSRRILIATPLMPYRFVKRLHANRAYIVNLKVGPFHLPASMIATPLQESHADVQQDHKPLIRPLTVEELVAFFVFERKLKTNRIIHSLQEFNEEND